MNSTTGKTLYLLDAYALIYRSYYAFINNPRITTSGINTSATFGFCNFLLELMQTEKPEYLAVVFDPDGPTFRHEMYPEYKAHRPKMPEDLRKSIPYIKEIIKGLGIKCLEVPGYEADDVVATMALRGEKEGFTVYMITPDKDYAQVVSEHIFMYKPGRSGNKSEIWGIPEVLDNFGIEHVGQVVDILGLMGDSADNVPGCAGIGPKSAATLVYKYGDIQGIYEHIDELKGKQKENLLTCQPTVMLSRTLVTINTEVPVETPVEELKKGAINEEILEPIFKELELFSLSKRLFESKQAEIESKANTYNDAQVSYRDVSKFIPELVQKLESAPEYAMHLTFKSGNLYNSVPDHICFSTQVNQVDYIKMPEKKEEVVNILELLRPILLNPEKMLISEDAKNILIWLNVWGVKVLNTIFDVKIAHYVLHPDLSHDIPRLALQYLNYQLNENKPEKLQLTLSFDDEVESDTDFAEKTDIIFQLKDKLYTTLETTGLLKLFLDIEMPLVPVLADMEFEGVSIDEKELNRISESLRSRIDTLEKRDL
ncbi:hypothetical protein LJC12_05420 [Odoribacter sp. OttesenSCG-928-J03]|nr:hypothetical protein [Odoribacter sp. OttesenSCG-928-J03]